MLESHDGLTTAEPVFNAITDWLKLPIDIPPSKRADLCALVCDKFQITQGELRNELLKASPQMAAIEDVKREAASNVIDQIALAEREECELRRLLPDTGYFADYTLYTDNSEAPLAYHVFCALAGLAATVNRRIFFDMGTFRVYPPLGVLILGPSGIKKTSAADITVSLVSEMALTNVYAEKLTPEALIEAMKGGNATGLVYSPEMTVLISRQRYMESIIPLLTRFMDSPNVWKSGTIMRGKTELTNVAITCLMCSTLDWFVKNTPETIFGGGFIARNIMILQEASSRIRALPKPSDERLRQKIVVDLAEMHMLQGEMHLTKGAHHAHIEWYEDDKRHRQVEHELLETYYQRKPVHLLRFAMCLHLATHRDMQICVECWERALSILDWTERYLPGLVGKMFKSPWGEDQDNVMRKIRSAGGYITHSDLVRRMQYRMSASQLRNVLSSLKEAMVIREVRNAIEHAYALTETVNEDRED